MCITHTHTSNVYARSCARSCVRRDFAQTHWAWDVNCLWDLSIALSLSLRSGVGVVFCTADTWVWCECWTIRICSSHHFVSTVWIAYAGQCNDVIVLWRTSYAHMLKGIVFLLFGFNEAAVYLYILCSPNNDCDFVETFCTCPDDAGSNRQQVPCTYSSCIVVQPQQQHNITALWLMVVMRAICKSIRMNGRSKEHLPSFLLLVNSFASCGAVRLCRLKSTYNLVDR